MKKRTEAEWQALLTEYQQSGLSQKAFCQQKNICPKGLNRHKREIGTPQKKSTFVQVKPPEATVIPLLPVKIELGDLMIYLPLDKPLQIAQLIKALQ